MSKSNAEIASICDGTTKDSNMLWITQQLKLLETNIDDMTPESLAFCTQLLLDHGAADVWTTPIIMKKGRAAHTLHCLCRDNQTDELLPLIFRHSTTLGVRCSTIERHVLPREIKTVTTQWINTSRNGHVDVKVAYLGEEIVSIKAEFEHCQQIAKETGLSIQTVADEAVHRARELILDSKETFTSN